MMKKRILTISMAIVLPLHLSCPIALAAEPPAHGHNAYDIKNQKISQQDIKNYLGFYEDTINITRSQKFIDGKKKGIDKNGNMTPEFRRAMAAENREILDKHHLSDEKVNEINREVGNNKKLKSQLVEALRRYGVFIAASDAGQAGGLSMGSGLSSSAVGLGVFAFGGMGGTKVNIMFASIKGT